MFKKLFGSVLLNAAILLTIGCGSVKLPPIVINPPVVTPPAPPVAPPPALRPIAVNFTQPVPHGVHVWFDGAGITTPQDVVSTNARAGFPNFPANGANPSNVHIRVDGYLPYDCVTAIPDGSYDFFVGVGPIAGFPAEANGYGQGWFVGVNGSTCPNSLTPVQAPVPPPPGRDAALNMRTTFQGLLVQTQQYGTLHMFEAALPWMGAADRQAVYAAKKAAGDTHIVISLPVGLAVYNECCNDFSPDRFPPLDWANGYKGFDGRLADLVVEIRQAGFVPFLFPDETMGPSLNGTLLAISALQASKYGDLTPQVVFMTGWDGVFYGWEPSGTVIPAWAASVRAACPSCYLGIEFNTGHIPLGEGGGDYQPGGRMAGFDVILAEFGGQNSLGHDDAVWQIMGRMLRPYNRPPDQPANDDPNPPFYLGTQNPRGPFVFCSFEFGPDEYNWVRNHITQDQINQDRAYLVAAGATRCIG